MFYKTIKFSELKNTSDFSEMKDDQVYQIFHRGSDVKVLMTQEKYFNLLSKVDRLEASLGKEIPMTQGNDGIKLEDLKNELEGIKDMLSASVKNEVAS